MKPPRFEIDFLPDGKPKGIIGVWQSLTLMDWFDRHRDGDPVLVESVPHRIISIEPTPEQPAGLRRMAILLERF